MKHRRLGRTGLEVSPLCLGAMMFGAWGNPDHDESIRIIHSALDAGINFIDTAPDYGNAEEMIGNWIADRRSEYFLASKAGCPVTAAGHEYTAENSKLRRGGRERVCRECYRTVYEPRRRAA